MDERGARSSQEEASEVDAEDFSRRVAAVRRRAASLRGRSPGIAVDRDALIADLFAQLEASLAELRAAERELRRQPRPSVAPPDPERRYWSLFELAPEPYLVTDRDGTIRELNRAARLLLGATPSFPIGQSIFALVAESDQAELDQAIARLRAGDRADRPIQLSTQLHLPSRPSVPIVAAIVALGASWDGLDGLAWLVREGGEVARSPARRPAGPDVPPSVAREVARRVDEDLEPVVDAVTLSLRQPNLPPEVRSALAQAAVALDGALQWMGKLRQLAFDGG